MKKKMFTFVVAVAVPVAAVVAVPSVASGVALSAAGSAASGSAAGAAEDAASSYANGWGESLGPSMEVLSSEKAGECDVPAFGLGMDPGHEVAQSSQKIGVVKWFNSVVNPCQEVELAHYRVRQLALLIGVVAAVIGVIAWFVPGSPVPGLVGQVAGQVGGFAAHPSVPALPALPGLPAVPGL